MSLPKNINKSHLLEAIKKIDTEGIPPNADSRYYDVLHNNKTYPPKLIVSYANFFANGAILNRDTFEGGKHTECFKLLERNGFLIVEKDTVERNIDFSKTLLKFLKQANEPVVNLKTNDYKGQYHGLQVKASFGAGNAARIPWLALLQKSQKVSKGIYPVYLYYREQQILILAYGISETESPDIHWNVESQGVKEFLQSKFSFNPERYGSSLFYSHYKVNPAKKNFGLDLNIISDDLERLVKIYNDMFLSIDNINKEQKMTKEVSPFDYKKFVKDIETAKLNLSKGHVLRFVSSLCAKPFVILTGLSGSGKTKLALAFAKWLCKDEGQICIVPVGADWTNREPLLGYPNALQIETYVFPENGTLNLLIEATKNPTKPYFLILDEMNLSHVERYFADFLSAMESSEEICLHPGKSSWGGNGLSRVPPRIALPPNLFIIGTVNIDETTYMFSPKVLDRASVIEFRISEEEMVKFLNSNDNRLDLTPLKKSGAEMAEGFIQLVLDRDMAVQDRSSLNNILRSFFKVLKEAGAEFGYRTATEIMRFVAVANRIDPTWSMDKIIDAVIMQKLLPRLHGSRRKLESVLKVLASLCLNKSEVVSKFLDAKTEIETIHEDNANIKYPISLGKIVRMYHRLMDNSFTSYAEV